MQDEKSQIQNRARAMQVLRASPAQARAGPPSGDASGRRGPGRRRWSREKIRTYNFKENRVTDHRIGLTVYKLDKVLAGELDEVSDALITDERARRLTESTGDTCVSTRRTARSPGGAAGRD